jgi:hypothetical protein
MSHHPTEDMTRLLSELGLDEIEFEEPPPQAWEPMQDAVQEELDGLRWLAEVLETQRARRVKVNAR